MLPASGPVFDSYPSADLQVRMRLQAHAIGDAAAQRFDFATGNCSRTIAKRHEADHARQLQHANPVLGIDVHEDVCGKQGEFQFFTPVLPAAHATIQRQKAINAPFIEQLLYPFFVTRAGIDRIPIRIETRMWRARVAITSRLWPTYRYRNRSRSFIALWNHSFATSLTGISDLTSR